VNRKVASTLSFTSFSTHRLASSAVESAQPAFEASLFAARLAVAVSNWLRCDQKHKLDLFVARSSLSGLRLLRSSPPAAFRNYRRSSVPQRAGSVRPGATKPTGLGMLARPAPSTVHELLNVAKEIFNGITPPSAAETRRIQRAMSAS